MGGREVTRGVGRPDVKKFAPPNGATRTSGQRGANRAREKSAGPRRGHGNCVKLLLPGTEAPGLASSGEQTAPGERRPARRAFKPEIPGIGLHHSNPHRAV